MSNAPYGKLNLPPEARPLSLASEESIKKSVRDGQYVGMENSQLRAEYQKKGKKKKETDDSRRAKDILRARSKYRTPEVVEGVKPSSVADIAAQEALERDRIRDRAIAVVDVNPVDERDFIEALDRAAKKIGRYLLKTLAPKQIGAGMALDKTLQELNILLSGSVRSTMGEQFERLSREVALVSMTDLFCRVYRVDKVTRRKMIDAKIEFMRPMTKLKSGPRMTNPRPVASPRNK